MKQWLVALAGKEFCISLISIFPAVDTAILGDLGDFILSLEVCAITHRKEMP